MRYGMSDKLGPITFGASQEEVFLGRDFGNQRNYSEKIAAEIDEEVKRIVTTGYDKAEQLLTENMEKLHITANLLLEKEKIDGDEFEEIFTGKKPEQPKEEVKEEKVEETKTEVVEEKKEETTSEENK